MVGSARSGSKRQMGAKMRKAIGGLKVIRSTELGETPGQTPGAVRFSGISSSNTNARRIWFGRVHNEPGMRSDPHHHGEAETAGIVVKGQARIYFGEGYQEYVDLDEGDFVYVPAYFPHIEANLSDSEPLDFLTARTPDNVVINLTGEFVVAGPQS
jgi:uncharacterized RmlC-like cupin family protein